MTVRTKTPRPPFSIAECLRHAEATLASPPRWQYVRRVEPVGELVARFVLPLNYCPTLNAFAEMNFWKRAKLKSAAQSMMLIQCGGRRRSEPLPGRPMIRAIRFTSRPTDEDAAWMKIPTDRLTCKSGGLCYIQDDKPASVERVAWCEWSSPGSGFCMIEVYSGC